MRRRHEHSLVPAQALSFNRSGPLAAADWHTQVLFRCSAGCTCPTSYRVLDLAGKWSLDELTLTPAQRDLKLVHETVAAAVHG
jgi:hypothetical protein